MTERLDNSVESPEQYCSPAYVASRLDETARAHYESCKGDFASWKQFRSALDDCYGFIAWHTGMEWEDYFGDAPIEPDGLSGKVISVASSQIHSKDFGKILANFRDANGKCHRQPYGRCLDALKADHILHVSESYSNAEQESFTKSYGLENNFLVRALKDALAHADRQRPPRILRAIGGRYPRRLMRHKIKEAESLYASLETVEGISCILPDGWENQCDDSGYFTFNSDLSVEQLVLGLKCFQKHRAQTARYGRIYDWFTLCPSSFRKHLAVDGKRYREIVDCPSGIFWMLAIAGYRARRISRCETSRLIDQCFTGRFYTDVSGEAQKTPALKKAFMKAVNTSPKDFHSACNDPLVWKVSRALARQYPELWTWLEERRHTHQNEIGIENHRISTLIEKEIMTTLTHRLEDRGSTYLRRVHDALWGIQDVPEAKDMLYQIAKENLQSAPPP